MINPAVTSLEFVKDVDLNNDAKLLYGPVMHLHIKKNRTSTESVL